MKIRTPCLFISILLQCVVFVMSNAKNCSTDKITSDIKMKTFCYKGHIPCTFRFLQEKHPELYNETAWRQQKVDNYRTSTFCKLDNNDINHSGLNIQWKLQNNHGADSVEGFEIRVSGYASDFQCDVIEFGEKITKDKIDTTFNVTIYPVSRGRMYSVTVITLPRTKDSYMDVKLITTTKCDRGIFSGSWISKSYNHSYDYSRKTFTLEFEKPPDKFKFTEFKVAIILQSDGHVQENTFNSTRVVFYNVEPGKYHIMFEPYDKYRHDKERCLCKNDEGVCALCQMTQWKLEIKKKPRTNRMWIYISIPVSVLVLLITLLIVVIRYGDHCHKSTNLCTRESDKQVLFCIDASSSSEMAYSLRELVRQRFKHSLKFHHVTYSADVLTKFALLIDDLASDDRKWCLASDLFCHGEYTSVDQTAGKKVIVCLMVNNFSDEHSSDVYLKIQREINKVATTYSELLVIYSSKGDNISVNKSFKISNRESLMSGIKTIIEEATDSVLVVNQTTVCTIGNECGSTTYDNSHVTSVHSPNKVVLTENIAPECEFELYEYASSPENSYPLLCEPEQSRPRYYSDDSGKGPSIKDGDGFWDNITFYTPGNGLQLGLGVIPETKLWSCPPKCNKENFTFYPPSTISEDPELTSIDSVMNEMMALNERNKQDYMESKINLGN
ncbi:hypothetical protein ACF0H5_008993 [Mactra antiquata]